MANLVLPRVQAMILCDAIDKSGDERGVYHLTGVRTVIDAPSFPTVRSRISVFVHMSGHEGEASCHVQIFRTASDDLVYVSERKAVILTGPTITVPVRFRLRDCYFAAPGVYFVEVLADNKVMGERRLLLRQEG